MAFATDVGGLEKEGECGGSGAGEVGVGGGGLLATAFIAEGESGAADGGGRDGSDDVAGMLCHDKLPTFSHGVECTLLALTVGSADRASELNLYCLYRL